MEFYLTQNISENINQHTWKSLDGSLHGICVDKNTSIEDAYNLMINYVESESPLGLS